MSDLKRDSYLRAPVPRMPMIPELYEELINPKITGLGSSDCENEANDEMPGIQITESYSTLPIVPIPAALGRSRQALSDPSVATLSDGDVESMHTTRQASRRMLPTLQSGLSQYSLTPSDLQYSMPFLRSSTLHDRSKAERMLGLRDSAYVKPDAIYPATHTPSISKHSSSITALPRYEDEVDGANFDRKEAPLNGRITWLHAVCGMLIVFNAGVWRTSLASSRRITKLTTSLLEQVQAASRGLAVRSSH